MISRQTQQQHQQTLQIKCQCQVYMNFILASTNKKSKFSRLVLSFKQKTLSIMPINQPKQQKIVLKLAQLRNIHQKYIAEGKMTLQFAQKNQNQSPQENNGYKIKAQVFIEDASSKNLELLIKKITEIKKKIAQEKRSSEVNIGNASKISKTNNQKEKQIHTTDNKIKTSTSELARKKAPSNQAFIKNDLYSIEREKNTTEFNRKSLMMQAKNLIMQIPKKQQANILSVHIKKQLNILDILPNIVIQQIFAFCRLSLQHRLINKLFSTFVLQNIQTLKFKDQVDQATFQKLGKYAINIYGKLKNVRTFQLVDRFDQPQLIKNRAKSLYFGGWKQISEKNINFLKGLRIYTLQLPYNTKFLFSCLFGFRLKQLEFVSNHPVTVSNSMARPQHFLYIMKNMKQLQHFTIPFLESSIIKEITAEQFKVKTLKTLKIQSVNINTNEVNKNGSNWYNFELYQALTKFQISRVLQDGKLSFGLTCKLKVPPNVEELELGSFIDKQILKDLPLSIRCLKLIGEQFINYDFHDLYLPNLKLLDVSQCPRVNPNSLQNMSDLTVYSNWDRQTIHFWSNAYKQRNIKLLSFKN